MTIPYANRGVQFLERSPLFIDRAGTGSKISGFGPQQVSGFGIGLSKFVSKPGDVFAKLIVIEPTGPFKKALGLCRKLGPSTVGFGFLSIEPVPALAIEHILMSRTLDLG